MRLSLSKRYPFSASHRLHVPELSDEENRRLFGKCNYPFGHGHNYVVEVTVRGVAQAETGLLVPRERLDRLVEEQVLRRVRHANLNCDVPELQARVPTTENLALTIERWLREGWPKEFQETAVELARVRVDETRKNRFEVIPDGR